MKKRRAKRFEHCPHCGQKNLLNLKRHLERCKKREKSVAPAEIITFDESLEDIEAHFDPLCGRIAKRTEDLLYDLVEAGLCLMKAHALHRVSNVGHSADGKFDGSSDDKGFRGWLETKYPSISRASAYNYIKYARGAGLDAADDFSAVDALRSSRFLAGKTAGDLARLTDHEREHENESEKAPRWDVMKDLAVSVKDQCEQLLSVRPHMKKRVFETVCARLHTTLEEMTGSPWAPQPSDAPRQPFFQEHGDVYDLGS